MHLLFLCLLSASACCKMHRHQLSSISFLVCWVTGASQPASRCLTACEEEEELLTTHLGQHVQQ